MILQRSKDVIKLLVGIENGDLIISDRLGMPLKECIRLRKRSDEKNRTSTLFGKPILITNNFWHLHSLKEIFLDEVYKFTTTRPRPRIIDCGANIGLSIIYFKLSHPNAFITGFESDHNIFNMLGENIRSFNLPDVELVPKAVWNEETTLNFQSSGDLGGSLSNGSNDKANVVTYPVETVRLREYLHEKTDMLKIDIEGAELVVLRDIKELLINVEKIFIEYHSAPDTDQDLSELLVILKESGFRVYIKEAWNNLPFPFMHEQYFPHWDLQLNIFGYRPS